MPVQLDLRDIAPRDRHPSIFKAFDSLAVEDSIEITNDHDPLPLHYQFSSERPGIFSWQPIEQGPAVWRVRITRVAARDHCCGSCGG